MVESAAIALAGGALGAEGVLVEFRPSATTAIAAIALALLVGVAAGLVPAVAAARKSIVEGLRDA